MHQSRRPDSPPGRPKDIIAGLFLIVVVAAATGIFSSPHHARPVVSASQAAGGGAFVPASVPTTTTTTAPPPVTTTTPPTTSPPPPPPPPTTTPHAVPRAAPPPRAPVRLSAAVGVYTGAGNPSGAAGFASATGAHVTVVEDYLPGGSWDQIDGTGGSLNWMLGAWRGSGYQLVLGVPMFDNSGTDTLAAGASGTYNTYFTTLAQTLVGGNQGNAILRLGQEFTGSWNPWKVTDAADAANYAAYYRQIVSTMRAVPGQAFKFIWEGADPEDGSYNGAYTADEAYPGDQYVDYIGTDTYDQSWVGSCGIPFTNAATAAESNCSWATNTLPGLTRVADFALTHGKQVVFPEWGLAVRGDGHGMGDDPTFVQQMAAWISSHNVAFDIYFDFDVSGQVDAITDGSFPAALATYRSAFG